MLFNSIEFLAFFPIVVVLYFATPHRARWAVLLAASYVFYGWWRVEYLSLILLSTVVDYVAGLMMARHESRSGRRPWLLLSLAANLGLLFTFKYLGFFAETADAIAGFVGIDGRLNVPALLLPVGISFYTFQTLSYSIDVYRGRQEPERHFGIFALYVAFWPQLVAGPIERSQHLLPQFRERHKFVYERAVSGLRLMLWGFFLKVVLADRLAIAVAEVYNHAGEYSGLPVIFATYLFAFQIYGDFAGYSLIAIGSARVMGFDLMWNFHTPYFSQSISEFWRRWHISLSTWFRDYLYIPLGGNRTSRARWLTNIMIVFLVSGLWHGAAWTFVIWGALHGTYLVLGAMTYERREKLWNRLAAESGATEPSVRSAGPALPQMSTVKATWRIVCTFHLVLFAWVFFRASSFAEATSLISSAFVHSPQPGTGWFGPLSATIGMYNVAVSIFVVGVVLLVDAATKDGDVDRWLGAQTTASRWAFYLAMLCAFTLLGVYGEAQFIYFQF